MSVKTVTFLSQLATLIGLVALTVGAIFIPLICYTCRKLWINMEADMAEFRSFSNDLWKDVVSLSNPNSRRFRRQFQVPPYSLPDRVSGGRQLGPYEKLYEKLIAIDIPEPLPNSGYVENVAGYGPAPVDTGIPRVNPDRHYSVERQTNVRRGGTISHTINEPIDIRSLLSARNESSQRSAKQDFDRQLVLKSHEEFVQGPEIHIAPPGIPIIEIEPLPPASFANVDVNSPDFKASLSPGTRLKQSQFKVAVPRALASVKSRKRQKPAQPICVCEANTNRCSPGPPGRPGPDGPPGDDAPDGAPGTDGMSGEDVLALSEVGCNRCPPGRQGYKGAPGPQGTQGLQGPDGEAGVPGRYGFQGPKGPKGSIGEDGRPGKRGNQADTIDSFIYQKGRPGRKGAPGPPGDAGNPGSAGQGRQGSVGPRGYRGVPGRRGRQGASPEGPFGPAGQRGPPTETKFCGHLCPDISTKVPVAPTTKIPFVVFGNQSPKSSLSSANNLPPIFNRKIVIPNTRVVNEVEIVSKPSEQSTNIPSTGDREYSIEYKAPSEDNDDNKQDEDKPLVVTFGGPLKPERPPTRPTPNIITDRRPHQGQRSHPARTRYRQPSPSRSQPSSQGYVSYRGVNYGAPSPPPQESYTSYAQNTGSYSGSRSGSSYGSNSPDIPYARSALDKPSSYAEFNNMYGQNSDLETYGADNPDAPLLTWSVQDSSTPERIGPLSPAGTPQKPDYQSEPVPETSFKYSISFDNRDQLDGLASEKSYQGADGERVILDVREFDEFSADVIRTRPSETRSENIQRISEQSSGSSTVRHNNDWPTRTSSNNKNLGLRFADISESDRSFWYNEDYADNQKVRHYAWDPVQREIIPRNTPAGRKASITFKPVSMPAAKQSVKRSSAVIPNGGRVLRRNGNREQAGRIRTSERPRDSEMLYLQSAKNRAEEPEDLVFNFGEVEVPR